MNFPRAAMGLRGQQWVHSQEELDAVIENANGKKSVFISHNVYPSEVDCNGSCSCPPINSVHLVQVEQIYIDLDSEKLSNAFHDCRKLIEWCENEKLPYTLAFSGKKGFQFCIGFKPDLYDINQSVYVDSNTPIPWREYYKAAHLWIAHHLSLRTLDMNVAEPKRIMRVWNTMHFKRGATEPTGTYCVPLTPDQVLDGHPSEILKWASKPRRLDRFYWHKNKEWITFDQFLDKYEIRPGILGTENIEYSADLVNMDFKMGGGKNWEWFKAMMPKVEVNGSLVNKLCYLIEMYYNHNPSHMMRFGSAAYWKKMSINPGNQLGLDEQFVHRFYHAMEYDDLCQNYDKANKKVCGYCDECKERTSQIKSLWRRGPGFGKRVYEEPSCKKLLAAGVCKGPKCELFKIFLSDMYSSFIQDDQGEWHRRLNDS